MHKHKLRIYSLSLLLLLTLTPIVFIFSTIQNANAVDITAPVSSAITTTPLKAGSLCNFTITWTDETSLTGGGQIFSTNTTGIWVNNTFTDFTSNPITVLTQRALNTTVGSKVSYRWFANDSSNNWADTGILTLTTTYYHVISATTVTGTWVNGTVADLNDGDADTVQINEGSGANCIDLRFNFTNVASVPTSISINVLKWYSGNPSHELTVSVWNYVTLAWVQFGLINNNIAYTWTNMTLSGTLSNFVQDGNLTLRMLHAKNGVTSHRLYLDTVIMTLAGDNGPSFNNVGRIANFAGQPSKFYVYAIDDSITPSNMNVILSTNNTGVFVNETAVVVAGTGGWANVTKTLNSTVGNVVMYQFFGTCTEGVSRYTVLRQVTLTDGTIPQFTSIVSDTTFAGATVTFTTTITDNVGVSGYYAEWNNSGSWFSAIPWTSGSSAAFTGIYNSIVGSVVSVIFHANDTSNNWASTQNWFTLADNTPPVFSGNSYNNTASGTPVEYTISITDPDSAVSHYIFSTNNSGQWVDSVATPFTSNPITVIDTLNATIGSIVQRQWSANDTSNNWAYSDIYNITTTDPSIPSFGTLIGNTTVAGANVEYTDTIIDNVAVSGYISSWNNTGQWINATWIAGDVVSITGIHNATIGNVLSVKLYANDTSDNWASSRQYNFTLTDGIAPVFTPITLSSTYAGDFTTLSTTITDNIGVVYWVGGWNNSGTWLNGSLTTFTGNPVTFFAPLNDTVGNVVSIQVYAVDFAGNWATTGQYDFTLITRLPTFSAITASTSMVGSSVTYTVTIYDDIAVSGYISSWNNSGVWVNSTWTAGNAGSLSDILNSDIGSVVSVIFYANDTTDIWSASTQYNFTLIQATGAMAFINSLFTIFNPVMYLIIIINVVSIAIIAIIAFSTQNATTIKASIVSLIGINGIIIVGIVAMDKLRNMA